MPASFLVAQCLFSTISQMFEEPWTHGCPVGCETGCEMLRLGDVCQGGQKRLTKVTEAVEQLGLSRPLPGDWHSEHCMVW